MALQRLWKRPAKTTVVVVALLAASGALWLAFGRTVDIGYMRTTSPDGMVDALTVMRDGGALRGNVFDVYLVRAGGPIPKNKERLFTAAHAEGVSVYWAENKQLRIDYAKAHVAGFRTDYDVPVSSSESPYQVEIFQRPKRKY